MSTNELLHRIAESDAVRTIVDALGNDGELYLVGGAVRDALLEKETNDIDLATKLDAAEVLRRLEASSIRCIPTALHHGTVTAVIEGAPIEITTFRAFPAVAAPTIGTDLAARDFTINAAAYRLSDGSLLDPHRAVDDLRARVLRTVGDPLARLSEDPLRILRMIRFGPAEERAVDPATLEAARVTTPRLQSVAIERIRSELDHIIVRPGVKAAFMTLDAIGALKLLIPELMPAIGCEQNEFHTEDVFSHILTVLSRATSDRLVRWATLFHDIAKPMTVSVDELGRRHFYLHEERGAEIASVIMERLRFSIDDRRRIARLVRTHMRPLSCGPAGVRRILRDLDEDYDRWREVKIADAPPIVAEQEFLGELARFDSLVAEERERQKGSPLQGLAIDGSDILALGVVEGPLVGKVLGMLLEETLDDPAKNDRGYLLERARELVRTLQP